MMDENSKEYVIIRGEKYYVQNNTLDLTSTTDIVLSEVEALEELVKLEVLFLNSNSIFKIENLENLTNLKFLNLSRNYITEIEGLERLTKLTSLLFGDGDEGGNPIS